MKYIKIGNWLGLFFVLLLGCSDRSSTEDKVIARVGERKLTFSKIQNQRPPFESPDDSLEWLRSVTKQWVDQEVLALYAEKSGMMNERDMQNQIELLKTQYISSMVKEKLLEKSNPVVSEEQIKNYYADHVNEFINQQTLYRVIFFNTSEMRDAQNALKDYKGLDSWEHLVKVYNLINEESTDTVGKILDESGILTLTSSKNPRSIQKLQKGKFSFFDVRSVEDKPIVLVLLVLDVFEKGKPLPLPMVSRNISSRILSSKQKELLQQKLDSLKRGTEITINIK